MPKALGVAEGQEMTVREEDGGWVVRAADAPKRRIKGDRIGSMPWLEPLTREQREFDPSPRPWDDPDWPHRGTGE